MASRKHPEPGAAFSFLKLPIKTINVPLLRIHKTLYDVKFFGKMRKNRFDAPDRSFGVMYLGIDEYCCFIETFGQQTGQNFVTIEELSKNNIATITPNRRIRLVDITGSGLAKIGADNRLATGSHALAKRWSQAIYNHPEQADGIYYRSCHDPERFSIALFDRAHQAIDVTRTIRLLSEEFEQTLAEILDQYNFALG